MQRRQLEQDQLRDVSQDSQPSIEEHLGKLENIVTSRVERLFAQHSHKENILHMAHIVYALAVMYFGFKERYVKDNGLFCEYSELKCIKHF